MATKKELKHKLKVQRGAKLLAEMRLADARKVIDEYARGRVVTTNNTTRKPFHYPACPTGTCEGCDNA